MHRYYALVVSIFAVHLGTSLIEGFGLINSVLPPSARRAPPDKRTSTRHEAAVHHRRGSKAGLAPLYSTVEAAEEKGRVASPRRDKLSPSLKRRVKGGIRRRARRLARARRKNKSKQDALARAAATSILNDVAVPVVDNNGAPVANPTYFPPRWDPRARRRSAAKKQQQQQATTTEAQTIPGEGSTTMSAVAAVPPETDVETVVETSPPSPAAKKPRSSTTPPSSTSKSEGRRTKHSTIRGRRIVKGGKGRGLWRSVFGPRPLLEVHSIDELNRLVDAEEWGLEDLSVLTWRGKTALDEDGAVAVESGDDVRVAGGVGGVGIVGGGIGGGGGGGVGGDGGEVKSVLHPTVEALLERAAAGTRPSEHGDGRRIGLAIEGGGMRGCVAAGMASCIHFLGLADSFDGVYGASAGSLVGAYFVSRQSNGTAVYHDILPSAGAKFIDMAQFPQALGFELPKATAAAAAAAKEGATENDAGISAETDRSAKFAKVIGLDFLLDDVVGRVHALDFEKFLANDKLQPLHIVASGVSSMSSVSLASRRGHFSTFSELTACIRASMLVPGLAGPLLSVPAGELADSAWAEEQHQQQQQLQATGTAVNSQENGGRGGKVKLSSRATSWAAGQWRRSQSLRSLGKGGEEKGVQVDGGAASVSAARSAPEGIAAAAASTAATATAATTAAAATDTELLVDAMVFEPLPYRSAIEDGCTDVVVLCTRPQGSQVLGKKPSIYETRVVKKYFNQHDSPEETAGISSYLQKLLHLRTYAEDALVLEAGSRSGMQQAAPKGGAGEGRQAFILAVAPDASCKEVSQLEMDRKAILQGCRSGFAACYDLFLGSATSAATAAAAATVPVAGEGSEPGSEGGNDIADIGPLARSGAEVALEYFPESLLSIPVDLNTTYYESGRFIPDYPGLSFSPMPTGEGSVVEGRPADRIGRGHGRGRGRGRKFGVVDDGAVNSLGPLRRLLLHAKRRAFFSRRARAVTGKDAPKAAAGAIADAAAAAAATATASRGKPFADGTPLVGAGAGTNGTGGRQVEEEEGEGEKEEEEELKGGLPRKRGVRVGGRVGRS